MLRARFITCFIWISSNVSGERPNYADAWLVNILGEKVGSSFTFLGGNFRTFSIPTQEIVNKAEDRRTFRGSSSFSGKTYALAQTLQGVRDSLLEMDKKQSHEQRLNFYMYN